MKYIITGRSVFVLLQIFTVLSFAQEYKSRLSRSFDKDLPAPGLSRDLTIESAVNFAMEHSPGLKSEFLEIKALEKIALQNSFLPNPELGIEFENFLGSGTFNEFNSGEITATISQNILLAGKISKKSNLATLEKDSKYYEYESKRLGVITDVRKKFCEILIIDKLIAKQQELYSSSRNFYNYVVVQSNNGNASRADIIKAELSSNKLMLELEKSVMLMDNSTRQLQQLLGLEDTLGIKLEKNSLSEVLLPSYEEISKSIINNPSLVMNTISEKYYNANIVYQEALTIPDFSIGLGIRHLSETRDNVLVAGISLPIPVFDSNKGNIERAYILRDRNRLLFEQQKLYLLQELYDRYNRASESKKTVITLKEKLIPGAEEVIKILLLGYKEGRYTLLDVLDTQKTITELEIEYFAALKDFYYNLYDIEEMIGQQISETLEERKDSEKY